MNNQLSKNLKINPKGKKNNQRSKAQQTYNESLMLKQRKKPSLKIGTSLIQTTFS